MPPTCGRCGSEGAGVDLQGHVFHSEAECIANLQGKLEVAQMVIREARIECALCRGKGYWSTDVYKNNVCHCKAGDVLKGKLAEATRGRDDYITQLRGASQSLLESLGEFTRQSMHANPEWREGIAAIETILAASPKESM